MPLAGGWVLGSGFWQGECHDDASAVPLSQQHVARCIDTEHSSWVTTQVVCVPRVVANPGNGTFRLSPDFPAIGAGTNSLVGAVACRHMALAEGLAAGSNGGYSAREWRVVPKRERRRDWWLTSDWRLPPISKLDRHGRRSAPDRGDYE